MKVPNPYENYPPRWLDFDSRAALAYRVFRSAADVNRFQARYRLAKAFRRLELDGYQDATARGYDALTRVVLAWSALEALLFALGMTRHEIPAISARMKHDECLRDLRGADPNGRFLSFVRPRLDSRRQSAEVEKFLRNEDCCVLTVAQAVRHIYLHGYLTPGSNQPEPGAAVAICDRLALAVMRTMDHCFAAKVGELVALAPARPAPQDDDIPF